MSLESIIITDLGKRYRIGVREEQHDTLVGSVQSWLTSPLRNFNRVRSLRRFETDDDDSILWALRDLSLSVSRGEVVGVIGRNGAGKSTLLKILTRITKPTTGRAIINGRVGSLLEVGTGFHQELTGRENIYLNGTLLGMTRDEVNRNLEEIIDFSGIERFIDTPVKRYSSGMAVRLGFSVAAHLEPEILLVDEVLAVGDAGFRKKCLGKMDAAARQGRTVLFVSHNMATIENLCDRAILLWRGRLHADGKPRDVIRRYLDRLDVESETRFQNIHASERRGSGSIRFVSVETQDGIGGSSLAALQTGSPCSIILRFDNKEETEIRSLVVHLRVFSQLGQQVAFLSSEFSGTGFTDVSAKYATVEIAIDRLPFAQGRYRCNAYARVNGVVADRVKDALIFDVEPGDFYGSGEVPSEEGVLFDYRFHVGPHEAQGD